MSAIAYRRWGLVQGPLSQALIAGPYTAAIFVAAPGAGVPNDRAKTFTIQNPQASIANAYIGMSGTSSLSFIFEVRPGDPPLVIDCASGAFDTWYCDVPAGASIAVGQLG